MILLQTTRQMYKYPFLYLRPEHLFTSFKPLLPLTLTSVAERKTSKQITTGASHLQQNSVKLNSTAFWKMSKCPAPQILQRGICEKKKWADGGGGGGGRGAYTGLKVLDQGISFLTKAEPSANV